jgi:hypothetical protein
VKPITNQCFEPLTNRKSFLLISLANRNPFVDSAMDFLVDFFEIPNVRQFDRFPYHMSALVSHLSGFFSTLPDVQ